MGFDVQRGQFKIDRPFHFDKRISVDRYSRASPIIDSLHFFESISLSDLARSNATLRSSKGITLTAL
jgi:hypothetical protein